MKLAKFLLNCLLFIVTFAVIITAQWGVTSLLCVQAGPDAERVRFSANEEQVSYFDAPVFYVEDLKVGWAQEDYYVVRNWFDWDWWKSGMKWADVAISKVAVFFKATFAPVNDIRDMKENHVDGFEDSWAEYENWIFIVESDAYKIKFGIDPNLTETEILEIAADPNNAEQQKYNSYLQTKLALQSETITKEQFVDEYKDAYQYIRIACHYNSDAMQRYYNKFIDQSTGQVKFSAITVYIHYLIALIVSIWFVHNNKFRLRRDEETGENQVEGGYKGLPGFGKKRKKKDKKNKKDK